MSFRFIKATLIAACVSGLAAQEIPKPGGRSILMLSPLGIDPSKDTADFNNTVKKITQAFSSKLAEALKAKGIDSSFFLDQDPKYDVGQKLTIYSYKSGIQTAIVMTIESTPKDGGYDLSLKLQYVTSEFITSAEGKKGIKTTESLAKEISIATAKDGWSKRGLTDMVSEYLNFLETARKL